VFRAILKLVIKYLKNEDLTENDWNRLLNSGYDNHDLRLLFSGVSLILTTAQRNKIGDSDFESDLSKLRFEDGFISDLMRVLRSLYYFLFVF